MKKIQLSIPRPCHENWDAMTQSEKGRFCASCQKTVIDFTNMSDRQLAEFFKKPPSSVCGRIYNDQLNRGIVIPKRRIHWIKYFFQFTWPAFVLSLKSCSVKDSTTGKMKVESNLSGVKRHPLATLGAMMSKITPIETVNRVNEKVVKEKQLVNGEIMGDVVTIDKLDSIEMPVDTLDGSRIIYKPMDTVMVTTQSTGRIVMGGLSSDVCIVESSETKQDTSVKENYSSEELNYKVYPNPVKVGSLLTVSFEALNEFPEQIQVLSSSGQLISQIRQNEKVFATTTNIQIPSNASEGIYFLRFITKNKKIKTTKFIVTK